MIGAVSGLDMVCERRIVGRTVCVLDLIRRITLNRTDAIALVWTVEEKMNVDLQTVSAPAAPVANLWISRLSKQQRHRNAITMAVSLVLLGASLWGGDLQIVGFDRGGVLAWSNSWSAAASNAAYRVEYASPFNGTRQPVTNLVSSSRSNSVKVDPIPASGVGFYWVIWTDAPSADPIGEWQYQGFEDSSLVVTGRLMITANSPLSGACDFRALGHPWATYHPSGMAPFTNGIANGSNQILIPDLRLQLTNGPTAGYPTLSGVMVADEFEGRWFYFDPAVSLFGPGSGPHQGVVRSGRFSARRLR